MNDQKTNKKVNWLGIAIVILLVVIFFRINSLSNVLNEASSNADLAKRAAVRAASIADEARSLAEEAASNAEDASSYAANCPGN
jgi:hypothetical protein